MDVGLKLWIFLFGSIAIVGVVWLLWSRLIGFPRHDPTASPSRDGDPSATDSRERGWTDHPHS